MDKFKYEVSNELKEILYKEYMDIQCSDPFTTYLAKRFKCRYYAFRQLMVFDDEKHLNWFLLQI